VVQSGFRFRDRARGFAANRAFNRIVVADATVRIARSASDRNDLRATQERGKCTARRTAAAPNRGRRGLDHMATAGSGSSFVDLLVRHIGFVQPRADLELLAALDTCAAAQVIVVRLDLRMQADAAVFIRCRSHVLRAERVVDDFLAGEHRLILPFRPDASAIPANVVRLLDRREQLERMLRCKIGADRSVIWNTTACSPGENQGEVIPKGWSPLNKPDQGYFNNAVRFGRGAAHGMLRYRRRLSCKKLGGAGLLFPSLNVHAEREKPKHQQSLCHDAEDLKVGR